MTDFILRLIRQSIWDNRYISSWKGFYNLFQQYFPQGEAIPIHYQEALLVVDLMFPHLDATRNYPVTPTCRLAFEDFGVLMSQRPNTDHVLRQKYGNTYWYYGFIRTA